ncbi:MAG TPA: hypothetical protein VGO92_13175 [Acidimicrobiales bacterium]|nr:hypothetical protein [Acidimicrobiales bacterium]
MVVASLLDGRTVSGGPGAHLEIDGVPVAAFEEAPTRSRWYTPWGGPPAVRTIAVAPDTGVLYVNVHVGGILRSADEGATWEATLDLDHDVHEVVARADGVVLAACGDAGLAVSSDGGDSWSFVEDGLRAGYARAVCVDRSGEWVLLSSSRGPGGQGSAVYRRPLAGGPFEVVADGLDGNVDSGMLTPDRFETEAGTVFTSPDGGAAWRRSGP